LASALVAAALVSRSADWEPVALVGILAAVAVVSDLLVIQTRTLYISGAFLAIVLAMALLGPSSAAAIGGLCTLITVTRRHPSRLLLLNELATYTTFPLVGGLLIREVSHATHLRASDPAFLIVVIAAFAVSMLINFALVARLRTLSDGVTIRARFRTDFLPIWPSELATALLAAGVVWMYTQIGVGALGLAALVLLSFQYLLRELLRSQERAEELEKRGRQLASLHVGVLAAMVQTLSLRDRMTARHSAAVARYSREIARHAGCSREDQELVHTAGLLHDIGKFHPA